MLDYVPAMSGDGEAGISSRFFVNSALGRRPNLVSEEVKIMVNA